GKGTATRCSRTAATVPARDPSSAVGPKSTREGPGASVVQFTISTEASLTGWVNQIREIYAAHASPTGARTPIHNNIKQQTRATAILHGPDNDLKKYTPQSPHAPP